MTQMPRSGWVVLGLLVVALVGYGFWYLYGPQSTITVTGTSTVTAAPDQFVFNPSYQSQADKSEDAVSQVSILGNATVAKLKELGVADSDLTTNVSSNQNYNYGAVPVGAPQTNGFVATFSITATVKDKDLAKKVVDYLATTPVQGGSVTPSSGFSTAKKTELENDARAKALTDAKTKADITVKTLGVHLLGVKSVTENSPFNGPIPYAVSASAVKSDVVAPTFETANQDYTFTVSVEYRIR